MGAKGIWWSQLPEDHGYRSDQVTADMIKEENWEENGQKKSAYAIEMPDGRRIKFRRVTTVLKFMKDVDVFKAWAIKMTIGALKERLRPGLAYTEEELAGHLSWAKGASTRKSDEAADIGTRAHALAECYLRNGFYGAWDPDVRAVVRVDMAEEDPGVQNAIVVFEEWWTAQDATVESVEQFVVSFKHGYCGRLDLVLRCNRTGKRRIVDFKTGKDIYGDYILQLCAYGVALAEMGLGAPDSAEVLWIGRNADHWRSIKAWETVAELRDRFKFYWMLCELYTAQKNLNKVAEGRQINIPAPGRR